jgi:hypothetical protein
VTQRVKKMPALAPLAGRPEYTRTWSTAINTITAPRITSSEVIRSVVVVALIGSLRGVRGAGHARRIPARGQLRIRERSLR